MGWNVDVQRELGPQTSGSGGGSGFFYTRNSRSPMVCSNRGLLGLGGTYLGDRGREVMCEAQWERLDHNQEDQIDTGTGRVRADAGDRLFTQGGSRVNARSAS